MRLATNGAVIGLYQYYYITRQKEMHRFARFRISGDMFLQLALRSAFAFLVSDQATRRFFVNYKQLAANRIAVNEVKKISATIPNAKKFGSKMNKPASYLFV